ncbi:DUF2155 domain-containing protein [Maritimibacter sp. HL-12]|uniref:DUF2155 domain-containing protein n=1 Tax=Maritimibacter sp. HL-12 TaxID=1162418 RepID=UPI000A1CC0B3|nr:DUF2155 domain-containing protein [Maritimibacter sp. HL-12]
MFRLLPYLLAFAAAPAVSQVVVVPLDPVEPSEVEPGPDSAESAEGEVIELEPFDLETLEPLPPGSVVGDEVITTEEDIVAVGTGARLRGLDKLASTVEEFDLGTGDTVGLGWLQITLGECRYPVENPAGDAYAWLVIREEAGEAPIFEGWMVASSPGLNALDHARFDVWVTACTTE